MGSEDTVPPMEACTSPHKRMPKIQSASHLLHVSSMSVTLKRFKKQAHKQVGHIASVYSERMKQDWKSILCYSLLAGMTYGACLLVVGDALLPFSPAFAVTILFASAHILGWLAGQVGLPPLLGMLFAGVILRNLPGDPVQGLPDSWSEVIRVAGLSIIFVRSGLELDWRAFKKVGMVALRLTCCPGITEAVVIGLAAMGLFGMPIFLGLTLGFILAAVSPAVVVNGMFAMQKAGLGVAKGIPSLVVAAASFDDVVAITGYSLFIGLAVPSGNLAWSIAHGPLNLVFGLIAGCIGGLAMAFTRLWRVRWQRSYAIFVLGQLIMHFFVYFHFPGAGAMASLIMGVVAMIAWEAGWPSVASLGPTTHYAHEAESDLAVLWATVAQPLLFSVIGIALDFRKVSPSTVPVAIGVILIGVVVRLPVAGAVIWGANLNLKERLFISLSWIPKATVQAALASAPLEVIEQNMMTNTDWAGECADPESDFLNDPDFVEYCKWEGWGRDIITIAVFSIILTAPVGLIIISRLGPKWLTKDTHETPAGTSAAASSDDEDAHDVVDLDDSRRGLPLAKGLARISGKIESSLLSVDLQLQAIQAVAASMYHGDTAEETHNKAEVLHKAVDTLRKRVVEMEFKNTPATQETAGQFFRVQEMEAYFADTAKEPSSQGGSSRATGAGHTDV